MATIFALNWLTAMARERIPAFREVLAPEPTVLAHGRMPSLDASVRNEDLDQDDLAAALREHGLERVDDTRLVVIEQDGSIQRRPQGE